MYVYLVSTLFFYATYIGLENYVPEYFPHSTNIVTRKYRIANSVKSGALLILCIPGTQFLYNLTFYPNLNQWHTLNMVGAVYAATDASALIYNPQCHNSTLIHHLVVQLFYYYCYYMDFDMNYGVARGIGVYCILSAYAYLVNFRLAIRFLPYTELEYYINEASLFIYTTTCVLNWAIQSYFLFGGLQMRIIERIVYMGALSMTINDDIFLIKFLRKIDYKNQLKTN
jgi:hypothetical protein